MYIHKQTRPLITWSSRGYAAVEKATDHKQDDGKGWNESDVAFDRCLGQREKEVQERQVESGIRDCVGCRSSLFSILSCLLLCTVSSWLAAQVFDFLFFFLFLFFRVIGKSLVFNISTITTRKKELHCQWSSEMIKGTRQGLSATDLSAHLSRKTLLGLQCVGTIFFPVSFDSSVACNQSNVYTSTCNNYQTMIKAQY